MKIIFSVILNLDVQTGLGPTFIKNQIQIRPKHQIPAGFGSATLVAQKQKHCRHCK